MQNGCNLSERSHVLPTSDPRSPQSLPARGAATECDDPRLRLLNAAGEVFARRGYRDATVREICRRADTNHAAVNYYFQTKRNLYLAVLEHLVDEATARLEMADDPGATAESQLAGAMRRLLGTDGDAPPQAWHGPLILRELSAPTPGCEGCLQQYLRHRCQRLRPIIDRLAPANMTSAARDSIVLLILAQLESQPLLENMAQLLGWTDADATLPDPQRMAQVLCGARLSMSRFDGEQ